MYIYCTENFRATYLLKERPKHVDMHIHKNHYYKSIQTLYNIHNKKKYRVWYSGKRTRTNLEWT